MDYEPCLFVRGMRYLQQENYIYFDCFHEKKWFWCVSINGHLHTLQSLIAIAKLTL